MHFEPPVDITPEEYALNTGIDCYTGSSKGTGTDSVYLYASSRSLDIDAQEILSAVVPLLLQFGMSIEQIADHLNLNTTLLKQVLRQ